MLYFQWTDNISLRFVALLVIMGHKDYIREVEEFIKTKQPKRKSVLVPFIPAIRLMQEHRLTYKDMLEFIHSQGTECSYSTLVAFIKKYIGKPVADIDEPVLPEDEQSSQAALGSVGNADSSAPSVPATVKTSSDENTVLTNTEQLKKDEMARKIAASNEKAQKLFPKTAEQLIEQAVKR